MDLDRNDGAGDPAERGQPERQDCVAIGVFEFEAAKSQEQCDSGEPPQTPEIPEMQDTIGDDLNGHDRRENQSDDAQHSPSQEGLDRWVFAQISSQAIPPIAFTGVGQMAELITEVEEPDDGHKDRDKHGEPCNRPSEII